MSLALSLQCCWRRLGLLLWQKTVRPAIRPGSALLLQRIVIIVAYLAVLQLCRAARAPLASAIWASWSFCRTPARPGGRQ